nr:MAG TPA: hypothetical protein [Caudoviricetes sp.]
MHNRKIKQTQHKTGNKVCLISYLLNHPKIHHSISTH